MIEQGDGWVKGGGILRKNPVFAGGFAVLVACIGCHIFSASVTPYDARLAVVKQDYSEAMDDVSIIEEHGSSEQVLAAMDIKCQILLDENSGYYNPEEGYTILKRVFDSAHNIDDASTLLQLAYRLNKPFTDKEDYLKYLAGAGVGSYSSDLINLYMSSKNRWVRDKAYPFLEREQISAHRNVMMARILINDRGGRSDILKGVGLLSSAGLMGSSDAEAELAVAYLTLISKTKKDKDRVILRNSFQRALLRAIAMGYTGELLETVLVVLIDGSYGIPQNLVLVDRIKEIRGING